MRAALPKCTSRNTATLARGPPPIKSQVFSALGSPANYTRLIESADPDSVTVIKFQAPHCRTCRATSPLLDRVAKQYPQAQFYSMDLVRNGKVAGERMNAFFKDRGIKTMPYIEIYYGSKLIESEVVPPRALDRFEQGIREAVEKLRSSPTSRGLSRQLALLRKVLRDKRNETRVSAHPPSPATQQAALFRAQREASSHFGTPMVTSVQLRRGAPLRGNTGGRRKGWRGPKMSVCDDEKPSRMPLRRCLAVGAAAWSVGVQSRLPSYAEDTSSASSGAAPRAIALVATGFSLPPSQYTSYARVLSSLGARPGSLQGHHVP